MRPDVNEWQSAAHAGAYLERADQVPHRSAGEDTLLDEIPTDAGRVLDLGSGDGRLLDLVLRARPKATGVALDFSPLMLERLRSRFAGSPGVEIVAHDLSDPLPVLGTFGAVVSSFAIHHLDHERKQQLYRRSGKSWTTAECSVTWSTSRPLRRMVTRVSSTRWAPHRKRRIPPTSCWTFTPSSSGCARSASPMSTATGSGGSWRCSSVSRGPQRHVDDSDGSSNSADNTHMTDARKLRRRRGARR